MKIKHLLLVIRRCWQWVWGARRLLSGPRPRRCTAGAAVRMKDGTLRSSANPHPRPVESEEERVRRLMLSDDPRIWRPFQRDERWW